MLILRKSGDGQNSPSEPHRVCSVTCLNIVFRSLDKIKKQSQAILDKEPAVGFIDKTKDSQEVISLVDELRNAIVAYQVGEKYITLHSVNMRGTALAAAVNV